MLKQPLFEVIFNLLEFEITDFVIYFEHFNFAFDICKFIFHSEQSYIHF